MEVSTPLNSSVSNSSSINPEVPQKNTEADDPIKLLVSSFMDVPDYLYSHWDVLDLFPKENPKLALVHYNDHFDRDNRLHEPLKNVRGAIYDLETGAMVADSFGHTENLACHEPLSVTRDPTSPAGILRMLTTRKKYVNTVETAPEEAPKLGVGNQELDMSKIQLFMGYEGVLARVFKWNGQAFFSTYKKIDATGSFWGSREPYYKIYQSLGGPSLDSFFGEEEQFSPYCHFILISHNQLRLASSVRDNHLFYIGVHKVWDETVYAQDHGPYMHLKDFKLTLPSFVKPGKAFSSETVLGISEMHSITVDQANQWLFPDQHSTAFPQTEEVKLFGVKDGEMVPSYLPNGRLDTVFSHRPARKMSDDRLAGGDFITMYVRQDDGTTRVYRLDSPAFAFRASLTNNNPVFYNQFVTQMPEIHKSSPSKLQDRYPELRDLENQPLDLSRPEVRQHYWHSLFYRAVPPTYKDDVEKYDERYDADIRKIAGFIVYEVPQITDLEEQKRIGNKTGGVWHRFVNILEVAKGGNRKVRPAVESMLRRENGIVLYKMIGALETSANYRRQLKEKAQTLEQGTVAAQ